MPKKLAPLRAGYLQYGMDVDRLWLDETKAFSVEITEADKLNIDLTLESFFG